MSTRPIVVIGALFCFLSCRSKDPPPVKVACVPAVRGHSANPPAAKLDAVSVVDAGANNQAELIVGSKRGLEAWQRDGSSKRLISRGTALHPRWIDDSNILVVASRKPNLAKGVRLERISLSDGKRSAVAKIPPFVCTHPRMSIRKASRRKTCRSTSKTRPTSSSTRGDGKRVSPSWTAMSI